MVKDMIAFVVLGIVFLIDLYGVSIRVNALRLHYKTNKRCRDDIAVLEHWFWLLMMIAATLFIGALILLKTMRAI